MRSDDRTPTNSAWRLTPMTKLPLFRYSYLSLLLLFLLFGIATPAPSAVSGGLDIYFIDVEGGAATLIVTPEGESLLMDCGWKRDDYRDARRIHDVATRMAGLKKIDI